MRFLCLEMPLDPYPTVTCTFSSFVSFKSCFFRARWLHCKRISSSLPSRSDQGTLRHPHCGWWSVWAWGELLHWRPASQLRTLMSWGVNHSWLTSPLKMTRVSVLYKDPTLLPHFYNLRDLSPPIANVHTCRTGGEGTDASQLTICNVCYFASEERTLPSKCSNKFRCSGLAGPNLKKCLKKWAKCLRKAFKATFGRVRSYWVKGMLQILWDFTQS